MKTTKYTMTLAALLLGLASCNNNEEINTAGDREQVNLSAGVVTTIVADALTRADHPNVSAFTNRTFKLIVKDNNVLNPFGDITQKVTTGSVLTDTGINVDGIAVNPAKVILGTPLYWDDLGGIEANLKLIGVYPYNLTNGEFSVSDTQTSTAEGTENANDLMLAYCNSYHFNDRGTAANLPFEHRMAKVTLNLIGNGDGKVALSDINSVTLNGVYTKVNVDVDAGTVTTVTSGGKQNLTPFKEVSGMADCFTYTAIIAPANDIAAGNQIATITTVQGHTYHVTVSNACSLEAGKNNIFNVTLSKSGVTVSATIKSWEDNSLINEDVKLVRVNVTPIEGTDISEGSTLELKFKDAASKEYLIKYMATKKESDLYWEAMTSLYWDDIKFDGTNLLNVDAVLKIKNDAQPILEEKLYAGNTTISKASLVTGIISFAQMSHPLCKLEITINTTADSEAVDLKKITNVKLPGYPYKEYDLTTIPVSGTHVTGDITVANPSGEPTHIYTMYIFPQTIAKDKSLIDVTTDDQNGLVNIYQLFNKDNMGASVATSFAPNTSNKIIVTLRKSAIAVGSTVTVSPWTKGTDISGDGTITQ